MRDTVRQKKTGKRGTDSLRQAAHQAKLACWDRSSLPATCRAPPRRSASAKACRSPLFPSRTCERRKKRPCGKHPRISETSCEMLQTNTEPPHARQNVRDTVRQKKTGKRGTNSLRQAAHQAKLACWDRSSLPATCHAPPHRSASAKACRSPLFSSRTCERRKKRPCGKHSRISRKVSCEMFQQIRKAGKMRGGDTAPPGPK